MLLNFNLIPTPMPPMLPAMVGLPENSLYWSICYYGSKATWSDGRNMSTFSFYGVYQPLINHIALSIYLWPYHLGSDDEYPMHALLCDRTEKKIYLGEYELVKQFLDSQHPPQQRQTITLRQWEEIKSHIEAEMAAWTEADFKRRGMLEMFGNIRYYQRSKRMQLVHWLDQQVTNDLLRRYIEEAKDGNYNAIFALKQLQARIELAKKTS